MNDQPFPSNPYVVGSPLTGSTSFYGRQDVFNFVKNVLSAEQQNVIVFYGQRRIGKTSLLHQIARKLKEEYQIVSIYFDLEGKAQETLGQVLYRLAQTMARDLKLKRLKADQFDEDGIFFREDFLPQVYEHLNGQRLLLLFDEFDVLGDELKGQKSAAETLFPYVQNLIMYHHQLVFIFVVGRLIDELPTHFQSIFKQAAYQKIGLLRPENAQAVITEPVKGVLDFEVEAIEAILKLTTGHPYLTQLICSEIFNDMKAKGQRIVTKSDVLNLVDQAIEHGESALVWFWIGLPPAERFILAAIAQVTDETGFATREDIRRILEEHRIVLIGRDLQNAPDRLVEWEMLRKEGEQGYSFVVELIRRWIIKAHPIKQARREIEESDRRAVRLFELAREAHARGDLPDAQEFYQRTLAVNPNHNSAQLGLAQVLFELGEIEKSIETYENAYKIDQNRARDGLVRARLTLGKKLEENDRQDEAILQYEQALQIAPTNEVIRQQLAAIWQAQGEAALSINGLDITAELYKKALDFDHSGVVAGKIKLTLQNYARQAEENQKYDETKRAIDLLRNLLPEDQAGIDIGVAFWTRRGDMLVNGGEKAEAIKAYQQGLILSPNNAVLTEKLKTISAEWERFLDLDRLFKQAMAAHQAKDWVRAQTGWQELIKMNALEYKEYQKVASLLAQAIEADNRLKQEQQTLYEKGLSAHQSKEWAIAGSTWQKLLEQGIENYNGYEIRPLLAEAQVSRKNWEEEQRQILYEQEMQTPQRQPKQRKPISLALILVGGLVAFAIVAVVAIIYFWSGNDNPKPLQVTPIQNILPDAGQWVVFMSDQAALGRQIWRTDPEFPEGFISENWDGGYDITSLAFGDGQWVVMMSDEAGLGEQIWRVDSEFPEDFITDNWDRGYDVTNLAFGNGQWVVIMSDQDGIERQIWRTDIEVPRDFITDNWDRGYGVTNLAFGNGQWVVIMSDQDGVGQQIWRTDPEFPEGFIIDNWDRDYDVTNLAFGNGQWVVIMSDEARLGQQIWRTEPEFPEGFITDNWNRGYDVTSFNR